MSRRALVSLAAVVIALGGIAAWRGWYSEDEREIRRALASLAGEFNASTTDGLGTVARAAQLGSYFTDDAVIDLGPGTAVIEGRQTLIGMAARLQPRTSAFRVELDDIGVTESAEPGAMNVTLTLSFVRRSFTSGEESIDAREFGLVMKQSSGRWRIARATAIDTLR